MASAIQVAGLVTISTGTGSASALEELGFSENGVEIQETKFCYDVFGDANGGDAGPPIDVQLMGQVDIIRATLTKYDIAVLAKIQASLKGGTAGTVATPGALYFNDSKSFRLLLNAVTAAFDRNYTTVIFREAQEFNAGTKHSKAVVVAHAYAPAGGGTLWNTTTT